MSSRVKRLRIVGGDGIKYGSLDEFQKQRDWLIENDEKIRQLAVKFEADKTKLEGAMERIDLSGFSDPDLMEMKKELDEAYDTLTREFNEQVVQRQQELQTQMQENIDDMGNAANDAGRLADSLDGVKMEASSKDASTSAYEARSVQDEFQQIRDESAAKLREMLEQSEIQKQKMKSNIFE